MIRASISKIKIGTEVRDIHAIQLTNERKITLDGAVTGTGYFDGSGDLTITTSTNHTHNYAGSSSAGGAANSANKLTTARTIQTNLSSTAAASFDGSANITPGVMGVLPVANGGTGVSGHTVNRLVWSTSATQIQAAYHYANNTKVAINSTSEPSTNFYVNGTSAFKGDITIQTDDTDRFINFANGDGFGWRIGYLGTGAGDANYLAVQSDGPSAGTYSNALRFGLTTLDAAFGGNVYPLVNNTKTLGTSSLKWSNVYATTFTGALNGNASSASKVNNSLIIKLNGGTTEGTNLFTFNGSAAKTINITPSSIGASASGHTHDDRYYTESEVNSKLSGKANTSHGNHVPTTETASNARFLRNDNTWQNVTPANIGAATSSHTHNYAGSSSSGGAATSALKLKVNEFGNVAYATNDTHILKLGYWNCTSGYDNLSIIFSSSFWGNQHGSSDIISIRQDSNTNASPEVKCKVNRVALMNSDRVFYYKIDNTNKRLYLYVYVTGGNSYGKWNASIIQSSNTGSWVSEYATNQTKDSSFVTISEVKVMDAVNATNVAWTGVTGKPSYYDAKAIKGITRSGTTFTYTCMDGTTGTFTQQDNNTVYTHPTTSGNKHIPSGGSSGQILRWSANGTAVWGNDNNSAHGHSAGVGLTGSGNAGTSGTYTYKVNLVNETAASNAASYTAGGTSKFYAVQLDKNNKLGVYVPWTDNNTVYTHPAGSGASKTSGFYKFSTDSTSHISRVTAVTKADITALGIPAQDTTYGSMSINEGTTGTATTNRVLTAANLKGIINAHAPTKTGGGASGTWGISISGNAATASQLSSNNRMDYGWNGVNYFNFNGTKGNAAKANDAPTSAWWHILRFNHANSSGYYTDLAIPFNANSLYYKRIVGGSVSNGGWVKVLDTLNYTDYTVTKTGTGASGTWGINISGNAATATKLATARTISLTGSVTGSGSFDGSGNLSIATTTNHSHSYLPLSGGTMTGIISSSLSTGTHLAGNKGTAIINSTSSGTGYTMLAKMNSTNGVFTLGEWQTKFELFYTANSIITAGTNSYSSKVTLLAEDGTSRFNRLYGAVWNDYAEYRICNEVFKPGQVVLENGDDTLSIASQRLQRGCSIVSDTFGFAIGETDEAKCPVAVSGRVLAYGYESREEFKKHIGWPVCSGPNGTVSIMTEEEEEKYPSRIIGTISAVPDYETWGTGNVEVNNRIWIKIK